MEPGISIIIPAFNEAARIAQVITEALPFANETIVIDDGSTDNTAEVAIKSGARVFRQKSRGYIAAIKHGFSRTRQEIIVTLDADGENDPGDIPRLVRPIKENAADVVLGRRDFIPRTSERVLSWLSGFVVPVQDAGTGFRALRRNLALALEIPGQCICGTSILEYQKLGARVAEVPINQRTVDKPRRIAWHHGLQFIHVLKMLVRCRLDRQLSSKT